MPHQNTTAPLQALQVKTMQKAKPWQTVQNLAHWQKAHHKELTNDGSGKQLAKWEERWGRTSQWK
jgi:hypothetical protein